MSDITNQPGSTTCFGISACATLKVFIECLSQIYQGADADIEFTITDEDNLPIDINDITGMYIRLYGDKYSYMTLIYPDTSDSYPITILQHEEDGEQVDIGIFSIKIPSEESVRFMTGGLYAEIKIKVIDTSIAQVTGMPIPTKTKIISCLKLADIKLSQTRDITDF